MLRTMAIHDVETELSRAIAKHPKPMACIHDGWVVIREEVDALRNEIGMPKPDKEKLRHEATQVAAMAIRFLVDVC